jgi:hypothetical protein
MQRQCSVAVAKKSDPAQTFPSKTTDVDKLASELEDKLPEK